MDCQSDNTGSPTFTPPREREREKAVTIMVVKKPIGLCFCENFTW